MWARDQLPQFIQLFSLAASSTLQRGGGGSAGLSAQSGSLVSLTVSLSERLAIKCECIWK